MTPPINNTRAEPAIVRVKLSEGTFIGPKREYTKDTADLSWWGKTAVMIKPNGPGSRHSFVVALSNCAVVELEE